MIDSQPGDGASSAPRNRRRLRSHLINGDVRLRLVLDDTLFALIAALAAIGILYYLSNKEIGDNLWAAHLSIKETRELLNTGVKVAGAVTFVAVLLFGLWSLLDAHRIAGPMHRLNRLLREIGDGNLNHEIAFRRRDEFPELAEAADRLVDVYVERITTIRQEILALEQALTGDVLSGDQIHDLRRRAEAMRNQLDYFRLPAESSRPPIDGSPLT